MAAIAAVLAWTGAPDAAARTRVITLFGINFTLHLLWSPLFFKWKRPDWAMIEMPLLWLSILGLMVGLVPYSSWAPWLLAPISRLGELRHVDQLGDRQTQMARSTQLK